MSKKYSLIGEDEKVFKVRHPDGSEFHIAKNAVGPEVHKRIKALKMAEGGEVPYGEVPDSEMNVKNTDDSLFSTPSETNRSDVYEPSAADLAPKSQKPIAQDNTPINPNPVDSVNREPAVAPSAAGATPPSSPTIPQIPSMADDAAKYYAESEKGIKDLTAAKQQSAQDQAKSFKNQADQLALLHANYQTEHAEIDAEHKQIFNSIMDQKIDPSRMLNNMGVGNQILAAISVGLSGIGSGLTGKSNMAMDVIQKGIDRDIESQKMELGKKNTLLSENLRRFGNLNTATQMTQLQLNAATQATVNQAIAKAGSLQAKSEGEIMMAELNNKAAALKRDITLRQLMMGQGGSNPEGLISYLRTANPAAAKEMEARYVPGVGMGSIPIPEKPRGELTSRQTLQQQVHNLRQWSQEHAGSLDPSEMAYGKALAKTVQDAYRRANGQGVFREAEAKFVEGVVDQDPTKFFNEYRTDPRYKALEDSNLVELNGLKKSYGLPQQTAADVLSPEQKQYYQWAKDPKNINTPKAQAVLKKLGMQ